MDVSIPCICPPKGDAVRHPDGDSVSLRDKITFRGATTIRWAVALLKQTDAGSSMADVFALLTENYVLNGIEAWSVVDARNKPVDVEPQAIRDLLLTNLQAAQVVADAADGLYLEVMLPLLLGGSTSSPPTPTDESTSPTTPLSEKPRTHSRRSSISTIPTAATETTSSSLDGVSNSSQSSESAA